MSWYVVAKLFVLSQLFAVHTSLKKSAKQRDGGLMSQCCFKFTQMIHALIVLFHALMLQVCFQASWAFRIYFLPKWVALSSLLVVVLIIAMSWAYPSLSGTAIFAR